MFFIFCSLFVFISYFIFSIEKRVSLPLLFSLEWTFLSISVCLLDWPRDETAFFFVFVNVLFFALPHVLLPQVKVASIANDFVLEKKEDRFVKVDRYVIILNAASVFYLAHKFGFSAGSFDDAESLMTQMNSISSSRYSGGDYYLPIFNRLVNTLVYAACGLEGYFICRKKNKLFFLNLLLLMGQTIITNTKATIVFGLAFWMGGYLTGYHFFDKKIAIKKVLLVLSAIIGFLAFTIVVNYYRHLGSFTLKEEMEKVLTAYVIGPYSAFSMWFSSNPRPPLDMGMNTFSCVFQWMGVSQHQNGEFISSDDVVTNVYTIFKHLINDYSYVGAVVFIGFVGLLAAISERKISQKSFPDVGISIVITSMVLVSFFSSLFRYSTNLIACIIIICFTSFNSNRR